MSRKKQRPIEELQGVVSSDPAMDPALMRAMEVAAYDIMNRQHPRLLKVIVELLRKGDSPSRITARCVQFGATPVLENLVMLSARHVLTSIKESGNGK